MKTITVRPDVSEVAMLVGRLLNVDEHEADLYGLYAPKKSEIAAAVVGQAISDEELDVQLARLTPQESETFTMLLQKLQGHWVEPPPVEEAASRLRQLSCNRMALEVERPSRHREHLAERRFEDLRQPADYALYSTSRRSLRQPGSPWSFAFRQKGGSKRAKWRVGSAREDERHSLRAEDQNPSAVKVANV